ncbi:hypothetical protein L3Q82_023731, partial [Scortum barcoo]
GFSLQQRPDTLTTGAGHPIGDKLNLQTAGPQGPLLVQDVVFTDEMAHFDRERIPERVVHAKGAGAFGYFEVTHDITRYCKAKVFEHVGKTTPIAVRFSTVAGESGSADTFPSFIHSQKRNPQTHMKDPDMVWDFWSLRPESLHQVSFLFSDRGLPDGYTTDQGIKNLSVEEAERLASTNPDYAIGDLFNAIANGNYPSWTFYIQVMTFEQAEKFQFNPFDLTKVWSHKEYPLIPVGKMVLNRNPVNYFAEVEQLAFDPSNMPPGIEPSPDKMLQGRLFSYPDTHRHRLGANYLQIPVNCPFRARVSNYQRDGPMCMFDNQGGAPNYYPNSFSAPETQPQFVESKFKVSPDVGRYNSADDDNVTQVKITLHFLYVRTYLLHSGAERRGAPETLPEHGRGPEGSPALHPKAHGEPKSPQSVENLKAIHPEYGSRVQTLLNQYNSEAQKVNTVPVQSNKKSPSKGGMMLLGRTGGSIMVQHTSVNISSEPLKDHIIWSLFSFLYSKPFCLGSHILYQVYTTAEQTAMNPAGYPSEAVPLQGRPEIRKMAGDLDGARHYGSTARCLNIAATVLASVIFLICFTVMVIQAKEFYSIYSRNSYNYNYNYRG